jgi:molybdenum cofactor cytidylyltransferase
VTGVPERPASAASDGAEVAGLVLAAGQSRRMGSAKLTLPWREGQTVVEAVVEALRGGGVRRIVVIVGADRLGVEAALAGSEVEFVENPAYAQGDMLGSIQIGLRAMGQSPAAALITPGDLPAIQPETVRAVLHGWQQSDDAITVPVSDGRRGHPVLLPRRAWTGVAVLEAGQSLRMYLRQHAAEIHHVEVADPGIHRDVDTPDDYRRAR